MRENEEEEEDEDVKWKRTRFAIHPFLSLKPEVVISTFAFSSLERPSRRTPILERHWSPHLLLCSHCRTETKLSGNEESGTKLDPICGDW